MANLAPGIETIERDPPTPIGSVNSTLVETSLNDERREDENYDGSTSEGKKFGQNKEQGNGLTSEGERSEQTDEEQGENDNLTSQSLSYANTLRVVKAISLLLIGVIALFGMIFSKISFVSITTRMYSLYTYPGSSQDDESNKSAIFFQLVVILVIPEIVSLGHCLIRGFLGKSSNTFPWPNWKSIVLGLLSSTAEVAALCAFIFGVACKLPSSLTILLLNGVVWVVIARHLIWDIFYKKFYRHHRTGYFQINDATRFERIMIPPMETIAFLMQLSALVAIPILLAFTEVNFKTTNKYMTVYILIPVTLTIISVVWSGWIQNYLADPKSSKAKNDARIKSGLINSVLKIILIPFMAWIFAFLLLDLKLTFSAETFHWNDLELSTFLTQIFVSFVAYLFIWIACALQSRVYFFAMLLSTPLSFVWYTGSVEAVEVFPFVDEYLVDWSLRYIILVVASMLWMSQILAFAYYIWFQNFENVLTNDSDLFWMPRYNGVFLEQFMLLNQKTDITGYYDKPTPSDPSKVARKSHIFICSTMYHENIVEMTQMLRSINGIAENGASESEGRHKYESHIFFDNACSGEQLNQWAMQLLGLLQEILKIDPAEATKLITPYGIQLKYTLKGKMPFYIHLKDNNKVKNKKRWSQVMYMNYVINYRIENGNPDVSNDKAFILTTDADVDFKSKDVAALLDILACNKDVGAVCGRTHPLGSGPVVWYQIFDYAIGHWLQKAAEHILGCVLCCPGCFSVFRVSALEDVLNIYSSSVVNGYDFLTKDMGEDRWLCTLLIKKGWRLEYSAVSQDSTYCPETFEEFYKQRRRWIPSTIANLVEVISSHREITLNNDSIYIIFILYQLLLVFSTLISPATVILFIATGLTALNQSIDEVTVIIVLCVMSVLYGLVCVYATEKTQIDVARILTIIFSIIMAVVISGILTDNITAVIEGDSIQHTNETAKNFRFPIDVSAIYTGFLAAIFIITGILHFNELSCLFHSFWYLICLPSGYLFLTIYSACNINNRSWGTRESASPKSGDESNSWLDYCFYKWHMVLGLFWRCIGWKPTSKIHDSPSSDTHTSAKESELVQPQQLSMEVKNWLRAINCEMYADKFESEGYTEIAFIAAMNMDDIVAIGVDERGFQLKLENEIKKLPTPELSSNIPDSVKKWLDDIKLGQHKNLFESKGYSTKEDVENLKGLKESDLISIGITRKAHLKHLIKRLRYLQYPSDNEIKINKTKRRFEIKAKTKQLSDEHKNEHDFWQKLAENMLKPESANLGNVDELKKKLKDLRNIFLLVLLLTNIMWIVFLYTLIFPQLTKYNLPDRAFSLFFLAIFSVITCIQFIALIFHRFNTLVHLLARTKLKNTDRKLKNSKSKATLKYRHYDAWFEQSEDIYTVHK